MQKYIIITGVFLFGLIHFNSTAQESKTTQAIISGKISKGLNPVQDSLVVEQYNGIAAFGSKSYTIPVSKSGEFSLSVAVPNKLMLVRLGIKREGNVFMRRIVEPGDSIRIDVDATIEPSKATFTGKGSEKYRCEDSLTNQYLRTSLPVAQYREFKDYATKTGDYQKFYHFYHDRYLDMLAMLDGFKDRISSTAFNYFKAANKRTYLSKWSLLLQSEIKKASTDSIKTIIRKNYELFKYPSYTVDEHIASLSLDYVLYELEKSGRTLMITSVGKGYTFADLFNKLKNEYKGSLREALLTFYLLNPGFYIGEIDPQTKDYGLFLAQANQIIRNPVFKKVLAQQSNQLKGSPVFDFSLPDTTGKIVSLKDLRGQVFLLDFWGEGCTACVIFHQKFKKKIAPKLVNETKFKVVSVNINPTRKGWIRGINSGRYTSKLYINLYTEGKILDHPFPKFYSLRGVPFLLLVDKHGKVLSRIDGNMTPDEVMALIQEGLKEPFDPLPAKGK
jgi:thiol-disulfide isomerase/thioredoxin